mmetsp:Transcript_27077/g.38141  ORF Transcript_27077/g.38141 Transcript_27077/m.38141 type:complete len:250 (-) Transcript_27077:76-825(-)
MSNTHSNEKAWDLYYWPGLPGRGEFVRLVFEYAGVPYRDVCRLPEDQGGGAKALFPFLGESSHDFPVFAPPFIKREDVVMSQTSNICIFLAKKYGVAPTDDVELFHCNQLAATIMDCAAEAHDTHHPTDVTIYYEEQKEAAKKKAEQFRNNRIPKFFNFFERVLKKNGGKSLVGSNLSYVDLMLFHLVTGVEYAFPKAFARHTANTPLLIALQKRVAEEPNIASYLKSSRRQNFNETDLFRRYPELDDQ